MTSIRKITGATLAAAAAAMLMGGTVALTSAPASADSVKCQGINACKGINVEQVLEASGMSRSNLEKRVPDETGDTIHAMIHREKLEKARELLAGSSLSINEISQMCGYPSLQYFYSVFRKEYESTPKEYRERHSEVMM